MPALSTHPMLAADMLYVVANRVEAGLWIVIGAAFLVGAMRRPDRRRNYLILALAFVAFGISDLVEIRYGQWWDPLWLLAWKGGCVLVFLVSLVRYIRYQRRIAAESAKDATTQAPAD